MALGGALVDKARTVDVDSNPVRVEGEFQRNTVYGPWFRCRLDHGREQEGTDQGRIRGVVRPRLIVSRKVRLKGDQRLEIISKQVHGHAGAVVYNIDGNPEPLRKKRTVIGWEAGLVKVDA
jgi:hypothetical protein